MKNLKYGLIFGGVNYGLLLLLYFIPGVEANFAYLVYSITTLSLLVGIFLSVQSYEGESIRIAFFQGMKTTAFFSIVSVIGMVLFFNVLAPDFLPNRINALMDSSNYEMYLELNTAPTEMTKEEFLDAQKNKYEAISSVKVQSSILTLFLVLIGATYSLVISILYQKILRKRR